MFQWEGGGCFSDGGRASFLSEGECAPWGRASVLMGGGFEKNCGMGGRVWCTPPMPPTMGNPGKEESWKRGECGLT